MEVSFQAKPFDINQAKYIQKHLSSAKFADIICHAGTDEDSIASARAMKYFLSSLKIPSQIIADRADDTFRYVKNEKDYINGTKAFFENNTPETVICMDFSSLSRINSYVREYIKKAKSLFCFDHHLHGELENNGKNIYVDGTAKSCSGVMLRFFQSLNMKLPENIKANLLCGMIDDLSKNNYIKFGNNPSPYLTKAMLEDKNTMLMYNNLKARTTKDSRQKVMEHLNVLMNLKDNEQRFMLRLPRMVKYTKNHKLAYVVIPPGDKEWSEIGGDNRVTSAILRNFRLSQLKSNEDIDSVAVFYPDTQGLRISIHSKNNNVMKFYKYITEHTNPKFIGGGHDERGGGTSLTLDQEACEKWVKSIIDAAEKFF